MTASGPPLVNAGSTETITVNWTNLLSDTIYLGGISHNTPQGLVGLTLDYDRQLTPGASANPAPVPGKIGVPDPDDRRRHEHGALYDRASDEPNMARESDSRNR